MKTLAWLVEQIEDLRTIFSILAFMVSIWSVYTVRQLWSKTNRPILSASIKQNEVFYGSVTFDLVVFNTGNRPATNIELQAKKQDIDRILIESTNEEKKNQIYQIFTKSSRIQLLINGDNTKTAFFGYSTNPTDQVHILKYQAELPIEIKYYDLDGNKYTSKLVIYVRDSEGFGGSVWKKNT